MEESTLNFPINYSYVIFPFSRKGQHWPVVACSVWLESSLLNPIIHDLQSIHVINAQSGLISVLYRDVLYIQLLCIVPQKVIFYVDITREIMDGA